MIHSENSWAIASGGPPKTNGREIVEGIIRKHKELAAPASAPSTLLSTLLGPACKGDYAC